MFSIPEASPSPTPLLILIFWLAHSFHPCVSCKFRLLRLRYPLTVEKREEAELRYLQEDGMSFDMINHRGCIQLFIAF